jgi:ElaB/YqjD/DUF883 family membrane-anchored ribosome-binding protein
MHATTQGEKVANAFQGAVKEMPDRVEKAAGPVMDQATRVATEALHKTRDAVAVATEKGADIADQAKDRAVDAKELFETTVRANPALCVGLALAAGLIVGAAWNSKR